MDTFVSSFFPLHESPAQSALVLLDQAHFNAVHVVIIVLAVLFPNHQCLILDIAMLKVGLSQRVVLSLGSCLFGKAVLFILKFFSFRDLSL